MCGGRTTPGRPLPGSQPREKPPPEPEPSAAKLNLAGIVWRKVWLAAAAAVKDWEVHNTMHRGDTLRWLLCRQICVPQPLRNCRCPGAGAGEGEEAGNYSALIYDNIIHRLNVCELVKSGFSVSIRARAGTWDSRLGSVTMTMSCSRGSLIINHPQLDDV